MSGFAVRLAGAGDAADLARIHAASFETGWSGDSFTDWISAGGVWLAGAPTAGFIAVQASHDEAEIITLAVNPASRGKGMGRDLLRTALAALAGRGTRRCVLEVATSNLAARGLYAQAGFAAVGLRRGYYTRAGGGSEDALILALALDGGCQNEA